MPLSHTHLHVVTAELSIPVQGRVAGLSQFDRTMRLCDHLRSLNASVSVAHGHTDAISLYWRDFHRGHVPHAVLLDWQLRPRGSDGYELARILGRLTDCTAYETICNIRRMDPDALVIIMWDPMEKGLPAPGDLLNDIRVFNHPVEPSEIVSALQRDNAILREQTRRRALLDRPTSSASDSFIQTRAANRDRLERARRSAEEALASFSSEPHALRDASTSALEKKGSA